jgi:hypothetical protein
MSSRSKDAFYVLSALGAMGTQVEILAGPLGPLGAARSECERLVRQGQDPGVCVVQVYHCGPEPRVR